MLYNLPMPNPISPERKTAYYLGGILIVIGGLSFGSVFLSAALHFGDFGNFEQNTKSMGLRAVLGMGLMIGGAIIRTVGARGAAGSGMVFNPQQAREDLEPYSRMAGGMVKDALDEAQIDLSGKPERVVMIKCRACGKLNEEDSKFCQECGKPL